MKIDNKKCFSCIAKRVCGPTVTPKMAMCVNFLKLAESLKPSHNTTKSEICDEMRTVLVRLPTSSPPDWSFILSTWIRKLSDVC
jgi:hypothetical protein